MSTNSTNLAEGALREAWAEAVAKFPYLTLLGETSALRGRMKTIIRNAISAGETDRSELVRIAHTVLPTSKRPTQQRPS